jgi:hypothetical protein
VGRGDSRVQAIVGCVIHKHSSGIYFSSTGNMNDSRSDSESTKVNQFFKYSKLSSSSLLFLTRRQLIIGVVDLVAKFLRGLQAAVVNGGRPPVSLITPSASTDSTSAIQLARKDTNLPNINTYFTLRKLYKNSTCY